MTPVEFGQEVSGTRFYSLMEIAHNVSLLLPDVDRFLEFHFPLRIKLNAHRKTQPVKHGLKKHSKDQITSLIS